MFSATKVGRVPRSSQPGTSRRLDLEVDTMRKDFLESESRERAGARCASVANRPRRFVEELLRDDPSDEEDPHNLTWKKACTSEELGTAGWFRLHQRGRRFTI